MHQLNQSPNHPNFVPKMGEHTLKEHVDDGQNRLSSYQIYKQRYQIWEFVWWQVVEAPATNGGGWFANAPATSV
ncbi:hypothetical protein HanPSC8_Chr17g0758991 [Helianthus annuus]|nr:hypothetical protein HanPSC8_Chr17g0758991 [Helianthus annuus]